MNWDVIGVIIAVIGLLIAVIQTWISLRQYLESKSLPVVADKDELRILRALITETEGRGLEIYKSSSFYRSALDSLNERGLIRQKGDKYYLTETGEKVVRKHLAIALKRKWFR
jgi:repressor of nif and glnA expression